MIGKYLDGLTKEQEDRILTGKLGKADQYVRHDGCRCVRGWGDDIGTLQQAAQIRRGQREANPGHVDAMGIRFDDLCDRIGEDVAGDLVRSRILVNQLKRSLAVVRETAAR